MASVVAYAWDAGLRGLVGWERESARDARLLGERESDYFQWLGIIDQKVGRGRLGRV